MGEETIILIKDFAKWSLINPYKNKKYTSSEILQVNLILKTTIISFYFNIIKGAYTLYPEMLHFQETSC